MACIVEQLVVIKAHQKCQMPNIHARVLAALKETQYVVTKFYGCA